MLIAELRQPGHVEDALSSPRPVRIQEHDPAQVRQLRRRPCGPAGGDRVQHGRVVEAAEAGHRDQGAAARLAQHVAEFVLPVQVVERDRDRPGPGDGELHRHELQVVGHQHADPVTRPDAERGEPVGQPAGPGVDLGVAGRPLIGDHERPVTVIFRRTGQESAQGNGFPHREPGTQRRPPRLDIVVHSSTV
jgi:hypothetical protein